MSQKRIESTQIILENKVAPYFPQDICKRFNLPDEGMFFFGESKSGTDKDTYGKGKFSSKYLALLHRPDITKINPSFKDSDRQWVRHEHYQFTSLKESYPQQLYSSYPLLVLRLTTEYMRADKPIRYMELLRYADHEAFRRRGIATSVFDSVESKLREEGLRYLYICARFKMPSTSKWLRRDEVAQKDLEYISTLFYEKPKDKVLQWSDSYLRIL